MTVVASRSTAITKVVSATLADVKSGDIVVASGIPAPHTATITAARITVVPAGRAGTTPRGINATPVAVATGIVTHLTPDALTVYESDGTAVTVMTAPSTTVAKTVPATLRDLAPGQPVTIRGSIDADGSVAATQIQEGDRGIGFFGGGGSFSGAPGAPAAPAPQGL